MPQKGRTVPSPSEPFNGYTADLLRKKFGSGNTIAIEYTHPEHGPGAFFVLYQNGDKVDISNAWFEGNEQVIGILKGQTFEQTAQHINSFIVPETPTIA